MKKYEKVEDLRFDLLHKSYDLEELHEALTVLCNFVVELEKDMATKIKKWRKCGTCLGNGKCPHCNGYKQTGYEARQSDGSLVIVKEDCRHCQATGDCPICKGEGGKFK